MEIHELSSAIPSANVPLLRTVPPNRCNFAKVMTMKEKQILTRFIGIQKEKCG